MAEFAQLPSLHGKIYSNGHDGRFRLWKVSDAPFDFFSPYEEGGPGTTAHTAWSVSVTTSYEDPACQAQIGKPTLNIRKRLMDNSLCRHPLDGTEWETRRDANRAAYEAGVIAFMVHVKDEAKYGIGTAQEARDGR